MSKQTTSNGKRGGMLEGKPHSKGGIKAVVTDDNNRPVELEGGEAIITKKAVKKHHKLLSKINQDGGGVPIVAPDSSELSKGVKVEKEHAGTAKKLFSHKITPSQAPESIAREHLDEDSRYYSKLERVESHSHGGTIKTNEGVEVKIGDEVWLKSRYVTITNITDKWVIFTDQNDGKRKDNPIETFKKNAGDLRKPWPATDEKTGLPVIDASQKIDLVTDPAKIQQLQNSITEGELILKAGTSNGKKQSPEQLEAVLKSVNNARAKLGLSPSTAYTPKPDDSKKTSTTPSPKFAVGEWVGVVDTTLKVTEVRKIAKAEKSSITGSWSYKFEKLQGGIETSGVGQKWICSVNQPKFSIGQTVEVVSSPNNKYNGQRYEIISLVYIGPNEGWSYKTTTNAHWSEKYLKAISSATATSTKSKFFKGDVVQFKDPKRQRAELEVLDAEYQPDMPSVWLYKLLNLNSNIEFFIYENELELIRKAPKKAKFFKGDIVQTVAKNDALYKIIDTEYIPEEPYKHWVYIVVDIKTGNEFDFRESQIELLQSAQNKMPLAKKHAEKKSHTPQPSPVDFDTMAALDKWASKNLENRFDVTLRSRTDYALLQLSTIPSAKAMSGELSEMRKNINQYVLDETGN